MGTPQDVNINRQKLMFLSTTIYILWPRDFPKSLHRQRVVLERELHLAALGHLAGDQSPGQPGLDLALEEALQGPSAEDRVIALLRRPLLGLGIERHGHAA